MFDRLVGDLERTRWYRGQVVHTSSIPAATATHATTTLHPALEWAVDQRGITLYRHQVDVIEAVRDRRHVVVTTPTASGKTLAFNLPTFEALLENPRACALYLYPLKALANDQLGKIRHLEAACDADVHAETYDGDTPAGRRAGIKRTSRIILSNPHALHRYLPWHHQWARVFGNLEFLILDEAHHYRGVFGANVALLIRRLLRIVRHYGGDPRIVVSSASVSNPIEFARALTGEEAVSVAEDASAHGERHLLFWDPLLDPTRSVSTQAARLMAFLTERSIQTICFARSRAGAEIIAQAARRAGAKGVLPYRAGYLPAERRAIEESLKTGEASGVVSTTALEAGIDIGGLDAAILAGFPGSLLSAWQQAGRAGRGDAPSLLVFLALENPLDRFFLHHPELFLSKTRERLAVPLRNPRLRAGHLACAAAELPLREDELEPDDRGLVAGLSRSGLLSTTPRGFIYRGLRPAHEIVSIDEMSGETVRLTCDGELLETMDPVRARRTAYPGAVLLHRGESYVIERLDVELGIAEARRETVDYHTRGLRASEVEIRTTESERTVVRDIGLSTGRVEVTESFLGYKTLHADQTVAVHPLDLPPHTYETEAMWIVFREPVPNLTSEGLLAALHGAEHALLAMAPLLVLCDAADVAGLSMPMHPQTGAPTILLFDAAADGAGIAPSLYSAFDPLAARAHALVRDCPCESGCPSCILSPRCGSGNEPLSKSGAIRILETLVRTPQPREAS